MVNNMNDRNDTNGTLYWLSAPSGGGTTMLSSKKS